MPQPLRPMGCAVGDGGDAVGGELVTREGLWDVPGAAVRAAEAQADALTQTNRTTTVAPAPARTGLSMRYFFGGLLPFGAAEEITGVGTGVGTAPLAFPFPFPFPFPFVFPFALPFALPFPPLLLPAVPFPFPPAPPTFPPPAVGPVEGAAGLAGAVLEATGVGETAVLGDG